MADVISNVMLSSDLPDGLRALYSQEMLHVASGNVMYAQFAERKADLGRNSGTTVYYTVNQNMPPTIRPLTEDQDVDSLSMSTFQVGVTVQEYGTSIGTTNKLDLTSYFGPISNMAAGALAQQLALTQDVLARNAFIGPKASYRTYAGSATTRATLSAPTYDADGNISTANSAMTPAVAKKAAYNLRIRRVPTFGSDYVALIHPAQAYDLRSSPFWIDVMKYTNQDAIFNGEIGKLYGVRFVEATNSKLPNAGATTVQTTLVSAARTGDNFIYVDDVTDFEAGQEVTLHRYAAKPDGTDPVEEHHVIKSVDAGLNKIVFRSNLMYDRQLGDKVTEGVDVFPAVFLGSQSGVGYASVLDPEIRVALPTDKLRRQYHVGWYGIFGYDIIRDWSLEVVETAAGQESAPAHPW